MMIHVMMYVQFCALATLTNIRTEINRLSLAI